MFGMRHSVVHHVIYEVYHLLQAQFFQQHFVVQNSQDHSPGEVSGTQYTGKEFLIVTEVFATVLVCKAQADCSAQQSALIQHTVQPFTESDDTRCCDNTICPPEDGHADARNMSRIVM
jgi:hypothetical protein